MAFTKITHAGIGSTGTVLLENLEVTGVGTFGGSVSVGGTLTYEDVTNVDSVGLITARNGIVVGSGITLSKDGDGFFTGVITATSYSGIDLSDVTGATGDFSIADKIIHTGDTDTALRFPAADTFTVETGGTERFRVVGSDKVMSSLDFKPDDNNTRDLGAAGTKWRDAYVTTLRADVGVVTAFSGDLAIDDKIVHVGDTNTAIRFPAADTITAETGGSERLRIDSSGRLLLGLTSDSRTTSMVISGNSSNSASQSQLHMDFGSTSISNDTSLGIIRFGATGDRRGADIRGLGDGTWSAGSSHPTRLAFYTNASGSSSTPTERLRITSDGKLGVGNVTPVSILHLHEAGSNGAPIIQFSNGDTGTTSSDGFAIGLADNESPFIYNRENTDIRIATNNTERFRIGSSGQFGIGGATYGTSGQVLTSGGASAAPTWGAAGKVLQVVHSEKPDHFLSAATTFADVASLSVTITPTSSSTKMLITVHVFANCEDAAILRLVRYRADLGTAGIGNGQAGNDDNVRGFAMVRQDDGNLGSGYSMQTLHTPGTTVEHTYKVQARCTSSSNALAINRRVDDASYGLVSSISVMEIG